jgi:hypothetical protein
VVSNSVYNHSYYSDISMLESNRVQEVLSEICSIVHPKRNGGFKCRCPVCGDSHKNLRMTRLHVDWYGKYDDWIGTCYNAGCDYNSGNLYSLYAKVKGVSFQEAKQYIDQTVYDTEQIKKRLSKIGTIYDYEVVCDKPQTLDIDIENDCLSIHSTTNDRILQRYVNELYKFISSRQIPEECYVAFQGRYKGRFIIPIYIDGILVYFQGRAMNDSIEPKYLNPVVDKSSIIMNVDKFDRSKYIIMTEGIIDAMMVENNQGTSVLGGYFDDSRINELIKMTDRKIILAFDNPFVDVTGREVMKQFMSESKYKDKVKYFLPIRKDFKDINDLRLIHQGSIYDYVVDNSFSLMNVTVKLSL